MGTSQSSQTQAKKTLKPIGTQKYTRNEQRAHAEPWGMTPSEVIRKPKPTTGKTCHTQTTPFRAFGMPFSIALVLSRYGHKPFAPKDLGFGIPKPSVQIAQNQPTGSTEAASCRLVRFAPRRISARGDL